jgi:hypothetical protein
MKCLRHVIGPAGKLNPARGSEGPNFTLMFRLGEKGRAYHGKPHVIGCRNQFRGADEIKVSFFRSDATDDAHVDRRLDGRLWPKALIGYAIVDHLDSLDSECRP